MDEKSVRCPDGVEVIPFGEGSWRYQYPALDEAASETFYDVLTEWRYGSPFGHVERRFRQLIDDYPAYIDARHHLAMLLREMGRQDEAHQVWERTVAMALACMPDAFAMGEDRVSWFDLDNRPFLRAYHGLALSFVNRGEIQKGYRMFKNLLAMNPGDNQGARALVVDVSFYLEKPTVVLEVCEQYPNDVLPEILYGRALAHYQLGHRDAADAALQKAVDVLPKVAEELVKNRHEAPESLREDRVTMGGADEAYHYWVDEGAYWEGTSGAIAWVREHLEKESL